MSNSLYTDLEVWKKGRELSNAIYDIIKTFPTNENFGLISQMRRSAASFPSNIAEGSGRQHQKETIQFFYIARGSLFELETQLFISFDQKYISKEQLDNTLLLITSCKKLIQGFINYQKTK